MSFFKAPHIAIMSIIVSVPATTVTLVWGLLTFEKKFSDIEFMFWVFIGFNGRSTMKWLRRSVPEDEEVW